MRRLPQKTMPKALACAMLEDNGRVFFLLRMDERNGIEQIELPCVLVLSGESPVARMSEEFMRQTGIDGQVHEIVFETMHNAGSRKRKAWIPVLAFRVTAKNCTAHPAPEFCGSRWFSVENAKKQKLGRNSEWIRRLGITGRLPG